MRTPCTLPLDPPLNILSFIRFDGRLDFRRLPGPVFDPPRAHFPEQRLVIEPSSMVKLGIYSTENGLLILENCACFAECYLFLGCGFGESVYSIAYFLQEEE